MCCPGYICWKLWARGMQLSELAVIAEMSPCCRRNGSNSVGCCISAFALHSAETIGWCSCMKTKIGISL